MTVQEPASNPVLSLPFTAKEQQQFLAKLWELLKWQTARYNGTDSTSLSTEKAQELLSSLVYTLSVAARAEGLSPAQLLQRDFPQMIRRGQALLASRCKAAHAAWNKLCLTAPELSNAYYVDTIRNLGLFFKRYDLYYHAHEIPCSIDYPLLRPVSEELQGIHYIEAYLRHLKLENDFLCCFGPQAAKAILLLAVPDYKEDYLNLCGPVLLHALGKTLLRQDPHTLSFSAEDTLLLTALLEKQSKEELFAVLYRAVCSLCDPIGFDADRAAYFTEELHSLTVRIFNAAQAGNLTNIFVPAPQTGAGI